MYKFLLRSLILFSGFVLLAGANGERGSPRILRGNWGSAGAPMQPWYPEYKFRYSCHAELSDNVDRKGDGREVPLDQTYQLYAVAKFELTNDSTYWSGDKNWIWVASLGGRNRPITEKQLRAAPEKAFATEGASASLSFHQWGAPKPDELTLSAHVKLPLGAYALQQRESFEGSREDASLEVRVSAYVSRIEGQPKSIPSILERSLYVVCEKKQ